MRRITEQRFDSMKLFHRELGQGQPIVMLHGIFGSSDNWLTHSRMLSEHYHTYALDLRNHGQSFHDDAFDYPSMVDDVVEFMETHQITDPILMGHSMGGKVAMNLAVAHPEKVQKLIVVDIAPRSYNMQNYVVLEGLNSISIEEVESRQQADDMLARHVDEAATRQFLLKNLQRKPEGGFKWKLNLSAISANILNIGLPLQVEGKFEKPTLFVRGAQSGYVRDKDIELIKSIFPVGKVETLDSGHWVPAEKPKEFVEVVKRWLEQS